MSPNKSNMLVFSSSFTSKLTSVRESEYTLSTSKPLVFACSNAASSAEASAARGEVIFLLFKEKFEIKLSVWSRNRKPMPQSMELALHTASTKQDVPLLVGGILACG
ncbi:unnamed protein product [Cochlearia groenlandica]